MNRISEGWHPWLNRGDGAGGFETDATRQIAVQENHARFVVGQGLIEGFDRVAGNTAKSGLLVNAPAQSPADARIQFNDQHALPVGVGR
jgi:cell shape-determining protein MreC